MNLSSHLSQLKEKMADFDRVWAVTPHISTTQLRLVLTTSFIGLLGGCWTLLPMFILNKPELETDCNIDWKECKSYACENADLGTVPAYYLIVFFSNYCLKTALKDCLVGNLSGNGSCTVNGRNMRSDFGLLCENYYLGAFIMSIPPGAHFFGAFISGPISDYLGRRIAMILSIIGLTTFSGMSAFSWSAISFAACFILQHTFLHMGYVVASVYAIEILGPDMRHLSIARKYET